ncbi:MAG: 6-phosphogluconolactonase [Spirochaetia bacterium]|jgi:6-phosphogluconolactonase|nr:6-phosphogluconolactonase [Spirochaetia bacterium]
MKVNKFSSKEQMSLAASEYTAGLINTNTRAGKIFTLALSGGSSPIRFYELMAQEKIDWTMVKIFLVDERKVSADHKFSNFRMIKETLLSKIEIPWENIFSIKTEINSVSECAGEYEEQIINAFGKLPIIFDLIVLGVGPDGHTASLFPGEDHTFEKKRIFISKEAPSHFDVSERLTMTLSLINKATNRIFVISGENKSKMINRVLSQDSTIPAGLINSRSNIFTDSFEL